jgi:hypothetical protein
MSGWEPAGKVAGLFQPPPLLPDENSNSQPVLTVTCTPKDDHDPVAIVPERWITTELSRDATSRPFKGFAGWLIWLAIIQTIAPFSIIVRVSDLANAIPSMSRFTNGATTIDCLIALQLALACFSLYVTFAMWRRSSSFPLLFTWQWGGALAYSTLWPALIAGATGISADRLYSTPQSLSGIFGAAASGLWVLYVLQSVRVRNTFVKTPTKLWLAGAISFVWRLVPF